MKRNEQIINKLKEERGDIGIKQIAITVAIIVILGFVITAMNGKTGTFIQDVWTIFMDKIKGIGA